MGTVPITDNVQGLNIRGKIQDAIYTALKSEEALGKQVPAPQRNE
jgi:hypothetical protein